MWKWVWYDAIIGARVMLNGGWEFFVRVDMGGEWV